MKPVKTLANTLATLLAADTTYLANASAMKVALITQSFTPSLDRVIADLTMASAAPLAPVAGVAGAQETGAEPVSGKLIVEVKVPAGGFRWNTGASFSAFCTVYGYALTNAGGTVLLGTHSLETPIGLTGDNQSITAPPLEFLIDPSQIS